MEWCMVAFEVDCTYSMHLDTASKQCEDLRDEDVEHEYFIVIITNEMNPKSCRSSSRINGVQQHRMLHEWK